MQYLRDKEFRMIVLISGLRRCHIRSGRPFSYGERSLHSGRFCRRSVPAFCCRFCGWPSPFAVTAVWKSWRQTRIGCFTESGI